MKYLAFGLTAVVYDHFGLVAAVCFFWMGMTVLWAFILREEE
jgi:hypothetical protein